MDWNSYSKTQEKEADRFAPFGEYDVKITDVTRQQSKQNKNNYFVLVSLSDVPEGKVPGIFLQDDMHTGDPKTDSWLRSLACHRLEAMCRSIGKDISDLTAGIPDDEPDVIRLTANQLIGESMRVRIIENNNVKGGKETVPVEPYGI